MNEDGSGPVTPRHPASKIPILAGRSTALNKRDLDTTLTGESPESPRYCEIQDPNEQAHYEYLYKARTPSTTQYEELYQEIEQPNENGAKPAPKQQEQNKAKKSGSGAGKKKEPEPLRPIEGRLGLNHNNFFNRVATL